MLITACAIDHMKVSRTRFLFKLTHLIAVIPFILLLSYFAVSQSNTLLAGSKGTRALVTYSKLPAGTDVIEGSVIFVHDGDTISVVTKDREYYCVRIDGIDAPESRQSYGADAARNLAALVEGMEVFVRVKGYESGSTYRGSVFVDDLDVGLILVQKGFAWSSPSKSRSDTVSGTKYAEAEAKARSAHLGLWTEENPLPPWQFRKGEMEATRVANATPIDPAPEKVANSQIAATSGTVANQPIEQNPNKPASAEPPQQKEYILGPRGGCYYINSSGAKVYVGDKSLCRKND